MGNILLLGSTRLRSVVTLVSAAVLTVSVARANDQLEQLAKSVGVKILAEGTSEEDVMSYSKSRLPYHKMSPNSQRRADQIISRTSQFRRMPSLQYKVDRGVYQYLVNNPDVAVATWRVMGISKLQMLQTGQFEYEASAPDGSEGVADVLWRDANQCIFVVQGEYHSPLLPSAIQASALVWMQYRFANAADGSVLVNQQVETFIYFPSHTIDVIAKLATRVTNTILDRNVFEVSLYAKMMSQAVEKDSRWVEELASRMDGVLPRRRTELIEIARSRSADSRKAYSISAADSTDPEQLRLSGQFRSFEQSMHQLNQHIPLVPNEVQHRPSYGKFIGSRNSLVGEQQHRFHPQPKMNAAPREQPQLTRSQTMQYFGASGRGTPKAMITENIGNPGADATASTSNAPPLVFATTINSSRDFGKPGFSHLHTSRGDVKSSAGDAAASVRKSDGYAKPGGTSGQSAAEPIRVATSTVGGGGKSASSGPNQNNRSQSGTLIATPVSQSRTAIVNGPGKASSGGKPQTTVPGPSGSAAPIEPAPVPPVFAD